MITFTPFGRATLLFLLGFLTNSLLSRAFGEKDPSGLFYVAPMVVLIALALVIDHLARRTENRKSAILEVVVVDVDPGPDGELQATETERFHV